MQAASCRWLCGALLATGCLALSGSQGKPPILQDGRASGGYIFSVLQRDDSIFAATDIGLYRAALIDKVWHKLPLPASAPVGGYLAREAVRSRLLAYYTGLQAMDDLARTKAEFYVSKDDGQTWECLSKRRNFTDVFIQSDGTIYANELMLTPNRPARADSRFAMSSVDGKGRKLYGGYRVVASHDLGRNWTDISAGLSPAYSYTILRDLDQPERIRLVGSAEDHAFRNCFYEATDQRYHWREIPRDAWRKDPDRRDHIFGALTPGSNDTDAGADLSTLFKYPFLKWGNGLVMPGVQIETEKPAYTFRQHEPMPVALKAFFVFSRKPLRFADNGDETICWALRGYPESGDSFYASAKAEALAVDMPDYDAKFAAFRDDPNGRLITLDDGHPYCRTIDLARLYDFPGPGKYRVQPVKAFCLFFKGDASFAGQVIEVTITP